VPTNVTPQYRSAEQDFREAETREQKIAALERMIALLPKHKGTDKLFSSLKQKLAKLKSRVVTKKSARSRGPKVQREGAGQVVLLGYPNVGKSALVNQLTNAEPPVADYPFTTRQPVPAMMEAADVQVQLVDLPAVSPDFLDAWVPDIIRGADAALLVVDGGDDGIVEQYQGVIDRLTEYKISLENREGRRVVDGDGKIHLPTILVVNKMDLPDAADRIEILVELVGDRLPRLEVSAETGDGLEAFRQRVWEQLDMIRIYTKPPGKPPDMKTPYAVPAGSTVDELATSVHREVAESLKFARIWGHGVHAGQQISREHVLHDGDLLELHT